MINRILTSLAVVVVLVSFLPASVQAQEQKKKQKVIVARTLCFKRVADKADIFINNAGTPYKILMPLHGFSRAFKCSLENGEALFYKEDGVDAEGDSKKVMMARARVGKAMRKVLFYFLPAKKGGKTPYRVVVMDESVKVFPMGHTRLMNLSGTDVAFEVGEHQKVLAPGKLIKLPEVKKLNRVKMAQLVCKMKAKNGKWKTISEFRSRFNKRQRLLLITYVDSVTHQPQVKLYPDVP